jgi:hypothetical protein
VTKDGIADRLPGRLLTLVIAIVASVAVAVFTAKVWNGGVVASAAISPVIVTVVTGVMRAFFPEDRSPEHAPKPRWPAVAGSVVAGILGGLLAFVIAATALTIPEVAAGKTITGTADETTFFGTNENKPWESATRFSDCFDSLEAAEDCVNEILDPG